jgi:hypothetical protein
MFFSIFIGVIAVLYILNRQRRIRSVPRVLSLRFPVILGVIGLIDLVSYTSDHHASHSAYLWVLATFIVGGVILGAIRALTIKLWTSNNWVVRQGTGLTMALWVVSLALHFLSGADAKGGAGNLEAASFLLYLAITYGVQRYVLHRRALPLWDALGPEAGQPLRVNFGQGPGGGAFFTTFTGRGPGFGPGFGTGFGNGPESDPASARRNDPTIIDVEVVEDDDGPAELR